MTLQRVVADEALDHLPADDPAALQARRDLARLHRVMATRSAVCRGWQALVPAARARAPLRILELGAGDGSLLLGVAQSLAPRWPRVQLTLLDRVPIVSLATLQAYAALGWAVQLDTTDVLAWARRPAARWDLISTSLFLHHFADDGLARLLAAVVARCDRFFAVEPRRSRLAWAGSHLVGVLGAHAVTRADAVLSVHAGFRDQELSACWPGSPAHWALREGPAGPFSHGFSARRLDAGA